MLIIVSISRLFCDAPIKTISISWELISKYLRNVDNCVNVSCVCLDAPANNPLFAIASAKIIIFFLDI